VSAPDHDPAREPGATGGSRETELLFVTRRPPFPLDNGARIRAHRLVAGLAEAFSTTLLTYAHQPDSPDGAVPIQELQQALPGVEIIAVPGLAAGKRAAQGGSVLGLSSWEFGRYHTPVFGDTLRSLVRRRRAQIVHFDDLGVAGFLPLLGTLSVFAPHNVEHRLIASIAGAAHGPRRAFGLIEARKVAREERRAWREADLVVAVSDLDARAMRRGGANSVEVCPNGTDRVAQLPAPRRAAGEPFRMLFVGSASYRPYEVGLAWFMREVYPQLAAADDVRLDIVGHPPRRPVQAQGVTYTGRVPSVAPYYERAHAVIVPVFEGSGTRLKIVEALAYGRPVVSTTLGAEGLPIAPEEHYIVADDAGTFAAELLALALDLGDSDRIGGLLARGRQAAEPLFWDAIVPRLIDSYRSVIDHGHDDRRSVGAAR
jgi:glycosyltransferase involved in cell wall biosynthesis